MVVNEVVPPWTAVLTDGEHTLMLFAVVAAMLALLATLVRVRFASGEVNGEFRTASLTASAVVAIAVVAYALVLVALIAGYTRTAAGWVPNGIASFGWSFRYADWAITVPLLTVELLAISAVRPERRDLARSLGMVLGFLMIVLGFLGGFVVDDGRDLGTMILFGVLSAVCFTALTALILGIALRSLPRLPETARMSYRSAVIVLLVVWFVYPVVYGIQGLTAGGGWTVAGVVALSAADVIAKVGFGTLVHRTAVLRSRADEDAHPTTQRRPRQPEADSLWVADSARYERDADRFED